MKETTTINIPNYNNKLAADTFLHIGAAPAKPVLQSKMPVKIKVQEVSVGNSSALDQLAGSAPSLLCFDAEIVDFKRLMLCEMSSLITAISNGVSREDFIKKEINANNKLDLQAPYAVYVIKKVK